MRWMAVVCITVTCALFLGSARAEAPSRAAASTAIVFGSDGMRPDLVEKYVREGVLEEMGELIEEGSRGENGLLPAFPPNTGTGWTTLATGAWTGVHGSTNNTFHQTGASFTTSTSAFAPGVIQAETLGEAAERAGKRVLFVEWPASRNYPISGPAVDFRSFFSRRGVVTTFDPPELSMPFVTEFGLDYTKVTLALASGWINVPSSFTPAHETTLVIRTTFSSANPTRTYFVYIFDSTNDGRTNYDRVLVATAKNGSTAVATLIPERFVEVKVQLTNPPRTAGFYVKVIDLTPDLSRFRLYFTSIARVNANSATLAEHLAANFPTTNAADFAPLEAGIIDEDTYVEQGLLWESSHWPILEHLITTMQPDIVFVGAPLTDEFSHQFLALITPRTPVFDDVNRDGVPDRRVSEREGYIRRAYVSADRTLALTRRLMPENSAIFVSSDHGFAPTWKAINASVVLEQAGLITASQPGNCRPASSTERVKACWAGGSVQVYVNLIGRDNPGAVSPAEYNTVREQIVRAFAQLRDGQTRVIDRIFLKERLTRLRVGRTFQTVAHPTRTGDVVVLARPPYQFDAATAKRAVADAPFFGQHGYWPDLVDLRRNVNLRSTFIAAGPGIPKGKRVKRVNMVDFAPTIAAILGMPAPANSQGKALFDDDDDDDDE